VNDQLGQFLSREQVERLMNLHDVVGVGVGLILVDRASGRRVSGIVVYLKMTNDESLKQARAIVPTDVRMRFNVTGAVVAG
jgi:hypothetical protein